MAGVILIEDDPCVRATVRRLLTGTPAASYTWLGEAGSVAEGRALCARTRPDVALLDLGLPDGRGADLLHSIRNRHPACLALVLTVFDDEDHMFEALDAGAVGYLLKEDIPARLRASLDELVAGGSPMSPRVARRVLESFAAPRAAQSKLTCREREVTELLARGLTYADVGVSLGITTNTVRTFIRSIYDKLHVKSKTEAVLEALRLGLVPKR